MLSKISSYWVQMIAFIFVLQLLVLYVVVGFTNEPSPKQSSNDAFSTQPETHDPVGRAAGLGVGGAGPQHETQAQIPSQTQAGIPGDGVSYQETRQSDNSWRLPEKLKNIVQGMKNSKQATQSPTSNNQNTNDPWYHEGEDESEPHDQSAALAQTDSNTFPPPEFTPTRKRIDPILGTKESNTFPAPSTAKQGDRPRFFQSRRPTLAADKALGSRIPTPGPRPETPSDEETIFVSLASYRDVECKDTVRELFLKAKFPNRVFIGTSEQNKLDEEACVDDSIPKRFHSNIRASRRSYSMAKGPTLSRFWAAELFQNETYYMQLDSHTQLSEHWDSALITMIKRLPNPKKSILTTYPKAQDNNSSTASDVPVLCKSSFNDDGFPVFLAYTLAVKPNHQFYETPFCAAGFFFAPGQAVVDVPFDPLLPFLFHGEEILYTVRLWTAGYDFFAPLENVVAHHYIRKDRPKFWNDVKDKDAEAIGSLAKVRILLGLTREGDEKKVPDVLRESMTKYGLGNVRTLEEYYQHAGIDRVAKTSLAAKKFCNIATT